MGLLNRGNVSAVFNAEYSLLGMDGLEAEPQFTVRDLWTGQVVESGVGSFTAAVPGADLRVFELTAR
jgi:hypothetical protein